MSWLAFETNVLGRLEFGSVAIPFSRRPELGMALKRRGKRVTANNVLQSGWMLNFASIQNNIERLSETDVARVLDDAYVPGTELRNPCLSKWFTETDAWWFDNVRRNLDRLESPYLFAIAASLAMGVGDYARSFGDRTRNLRQPLSVVYKRLWRDLPNPINNSQNNNCENKSANEFLAETLVELMFLRLPQGRSAVTDEDRWKEEWLRGDDRFWTGLEDEQRSKLGSGFETKSQFLQSLEETLSIGSNIRHWAISHVEDGTVSTQDIMETVSRIRRVDAVYTKDFTELLGAKAVIITA